MSLDYYSILDLKRSCTDLEINTAYRLLALKYHPDKKENAGSLDASKKFALVSEAYRVLSDSGRRAIFDQYGSKGLKEGVKTADGGFLPGWVFSESPNALFESHTGSNTPNNPTFSTLTLFNQQTNAKPKLKCPPQEVNVYCSLEELYVGCVKRVKILRRSLGSTPAPLPADWSEPEVVEEKILTLNVEPGWKQGTKITFTHEGDEKINFEAGDVIFTLCEKPHPRFRRSGSSLLYTCSLSLYSALCGTTISIELLDGRHLPVAVVGLEDTKSTLTVNGEGMPIYDKNKNKNTNQNQESGNKGQKGDLVIDFNIAMPDNLTLEQKNALKDILGE